jgi:type II secretory pathway predicted ATPase ExeA
MLLEYYKFAVEPFGVTPDPAFLFLSPTHREALASMLHGIRSGRGFTALIAEPGMGKTTLLFDLLRMLKGTATTAFLFQTLCGPREFLRALLDDLGIEGDGADFTRMHAQLNEFLLRESLLGRQLVVIVDEAQNLDEQVLEVVRMLSNFETANRKLMHVVLAGQPGLAEKLASESLSQLQQRISIVARLAPLNSEETREYIEHRLRVAGFTSGKPLFTNQAYAMIADHSRGIPRNINNLCFNALSLCCGLKCRTVNASVVRETIDDLDLRTLVHPAAKLVNRRVGHRGHALFAFLSERVCSVSKSLATAVVDFLGWQGYPAIESTRLRDLPESLTTSSRQGSNNGLERSLKSSTPLVWNLKREPERRPAAGSLTAQLGPNPQLKDTEKTTETTLSECKLRTKPDPTSSIVGMMDARRYDSGFLAGILDRDPQLKDPGHLELDKVLRILMKWQVPREIQPVPGGNPAPSEFAAQRERL